MQQACNPSFHLAARTDVILIKLLIDELFETNVTKNGSISSLETQDSESGQMGDYGIRTRPIVIRYGKEELLVKIAYLTSDWTDCMCQEQSDTYDSTCNINKD